MNNQNNSPTPTQTQSQTPTPTTPTQNEPTLVTDPYGSGATFGWSGSTGIDHIPKAGDPDFGAYQNALHDWLVNREMAYRESPKYQADQAAGNPAIASGQIPAIGYRAEGPNAWNVPVGATVTSLTQQQGGGWQVGYREQGTPQQVKVSGPGYSFEGTIYAANAQEAAQKAMAGASVQIAGIDVSPSKLGGYVASSGGTFLDGKLTGGEATVQVGDPERNAYWVSKGLPQFAGYSIPKVSDVDAGQGYYVKDVTSGVTQPNVVIGNKVYEDFWAGQGRPDLGNYQAPKLESGQYIFNPTVNAEGQLSYGVGNTEWEKQWQRLGVTDTTKIRGYTPPTLEQGGYIKEVTQTSQGLNFTIGNTIQEAKIAEANSQLADINSQLATINRQNQVFTDTFNAGKISLGDFQKAITKQNENTVNLLNTAESSGFITSTEKQADIMQLNANMQSINSLFSNITKTAPQSEPTKVYSAFNPAISPLGVDPTSDLVRLAQTNKGETLLINSNYKVSSKEVTDINGQKQVALTLIPNINPNAVQQAIDLHDIQSSFMQRSGSQQGTRTFGVSEATITQGLTAEQKVAYQDALTQRTQTRLLNLGTMIASAATVPAIGVGAAVKAGTIGLVLKQRVKTGSAVLQGQDITKSLVTPQEAVEGVSSGIIFAGVGQAANTALKITGSGLSNAAARIATSGIIGGAGGTTQEYLQTGKVSGVGTLEGVGFGVGFGVVSEGAVAVNNKFDITGKIGNKVQDIALKSPEVLQKLDVVQNRYDTALRANQIPEYSVTDKLVMKLTGVTPQKPEAQYIPLPTTPTTNEWKVDPKTGFITDKFASDMGVTVKTYGKEINPITAEGPNAWTGEITMQRAEVIRYKTLTQAGLADNTTVFIGRSESAQTLYATERSSTPDFLGNSSQKGLGGNTQKVRVKTQAEKNFETNRIVDDYLADLGVGSESTVKVSAPKDFTETVKIEQAGIRGKLSTDRITSLQDLQTQLSSEENVAIPKTEFMDPSQFTEARAVFNKSQTKGALAPSQMAEITGEAAQPTGIGKAIGDLQYGRAIDTGRYGIRGKVSTIMAYSSPTMTPQETMAPQAIISETITTNPNNTPLVVGTQTPTFQTDNIGTFKRSYANSSFSPNPQSYEQQLINSALKQSFSHQPQERNRTMILNTAILTSEIGTNLGRSTANYPYTSPQQANQLSPLTQPELDAQLQQLTKTLTREAPLTEPLTQTRPDTLTALRMQQTFPSFTLYTDDNSMNPFTPSNRSKKKPGVRSIPFTNPILTGYQLLGKKYSGDEPRSKRKGRNPFW